MTAGAIGALEPAPSPAAKAGARLLGIDALRGLVMVLMTVDHASSAFNSGRLMVDSASSYKPGMPLDPSQFYTRWITHLCAPTFVFLAGVSLALSAARRGAPSRRDDRFLVTRGLFIAACDPLWMSWAFGAKGILFQVLYAIGMSFVAMAALRRLPPRWLGLLALAGLVGHEALAGLAVSLVGGTPNAPLRLLLTGGPVPPFLVAYPLVPWLSVMALGHAAGSLVAGRSNAELARWSLRAGVASLAVFAAVRGIDGYGNARIHRDDGSLIQWLHVSKYPPSLAYLALELGLMAILLALFCSLPERRLAPLVLLGQTAFFFYLLHVHLLEGASYLFDLHRHASLGGTYLAAALTVGALAPLCVLYRRYKSAHRDGWTRYV